MVRCPICKYEHSIDAHYCVRCGNHIPSHMAPPKDTDRLRIWGGELRMISVLFVSVSGFDLLIKEKDAHEVMMYLRECLVDVNEFICTYDGTADLMPADYRMLGIFGAPRAHKDDPLRAIRCAMRIKEWWKTKKAKVDFFKEINLSIGVNTGRAFFGYILEEKSTLTVIGDTINSAARLAEICPPNEILISDSIYYRVEGQVETEHLGKRSVKGRAAKIDMYLLKALKEEGEMVAAQKIPLYGRDSELKRLMQLATHLNETKLKFCIISGQMGIGKTRLKEEFQRMLAERDTVHSVETHCSMEVPSPYYPFKFLLRHYFDLGDINNPTELAARLNEIVVERKLSDFTKRGLIHLFCTDIQRLKHIDLVKINEEIYAGVRDILRYECQRKPLILIFEEFNRADDLSKYLIAYLTTELKDEALMFLMVNVSREFVTNMNIAVEELNLTPLVLSDIKELTVFLLDKVDEELIEFVYNAAGGNPLFTIETIRNTRRSAMIRKIDGYWCLEREQRLPFLDDLYGVVMSTVDSLPTDYRLILDYASVIGYSFSMRVLDRLLDNPTLPEQLDFLAQQGYVILTKDGKDPVYVFRHNLLKDATYTVLPLRKRREIHELVASLYEETYPDQLSDYYETIGHHYLSSEKYGKAANYIKLAGDKAKNLYALDQAVHFYSTVMKIADETDGEVSDELMRAVMLNFTDVYELNGEVSKMQKIAQQGLANAKAANDLQSEVNFAERYAYALFLQNAFEKAEGVLLTGIERCTDEMNDILSVLYSDLGLLYQLKYEYEKSILNYNLSWNTARANNITKSEILCLYNLSQLHRDLGNYELALEYLTHGIDDLISPDDVRWNILFKYLIADIYHQIWDTERAKALNDECLKKAESIGSVEIYINAALDCAELHAQLSQRALAEEYIRKADSKVSLLIREQLLAVVNLKKAIVFYYNGEQQKTHDFIKNALKAGRKFGDRKIEFYGAYLMSLIDSENALDHARKALDIAEAIRLAPLIAKALYQMTEICITIDDKDKARYYGQKALLVYDDIKLKLNDEHMKAFNAMPEYTRLLEI